MYGAGGMHGKRFGPGQNSRAPAEEILALRDVSKSYRRPSWVPGRSHPPVVALRNVSLSVVRGRTLAIIGASGAGKSTLARCMASVILPDSGQICFEGRNLVDVESSDIHQLRRQIQLIFQQSAASLNPHFSVLDAVSEPLRIAGVKSRSEQREAGLALMEAVGLPRTAAARQSTELSGGQRQRVAIARALAVEPKLLILDESLSGFDMPTQARVVNLLFDLQTTRDVSYIFVTHDLRLAAHVSDDLAVFCNGCAIEHGPTDQIIQNPHHSYTRKLLSSMERFGES